MRLNDIVSESFSPLGSAAAPGSSVPLASDTYGSGVPQRDFAAVAPVQEFAALRPPLQASAPQARSAAAGPAYGFAAPLPRIPGGSVIDIPYKSNFAGPFPSSLASRLSPEEFRSIHRRLRSAYMKGRINALRPTGIVSALTCSLGTPIMYFATKSLVQKERVREAQDLSAEFASRGIRIEVGDKSPVSIRIVLS